MAKHLPRMIIHAWWKKSHPRVKWAMPAVQQLWWLGLCPTQLYQHHVPCLSAMEDRNITWIPSLHGSRDHECRVSWDFEGKCGKRSEKCVLRKSRNGGKSILTQMGVAYLGRCVRTQGIQGKNNFVFPTYGARVTGQNVKWAVIAPPWGRQINVWVN